MKRIKSFLRVTSVSRIATFGAALATATFIAEVIVLIGEMLVFESHPYVGILAYVMLPGAFVLGLVMIPLGILLRVRRAGVGFSLSAIDGLAAARRISLGHVGQVIVTLSLLNLVIFGVIGYRGLHYTESVAFCGEVCHEVMHPEFEAYQRSAHAQVECVECHIGSGASSFVKSKLSGVRQLVGVVRGDFSRPIPTPVHNLRAAHDICESCHQPEALHGDRLRVIEHFEPDERNTRTYTALNMRVGGGDAPGRPAHGIHWHASGEHEVRYYATDEKREEIVWVERRNPDGTRRVWTVPSAPVARPEEALQRRMDCMDCHNRPAHVFLAPDVALDEWMATDRIDPEIPWIRAVAESVIMERFDSREAAIEGIARLPERYRDAHPDLWPEYEERVRATVAPLQQLHRENVFPEMNIQWNTYTSRIGHATPHTQACFRCHNGVLRDETGASITMDCTSCHYVLADREVDPRILERLVH